MRQARSYRLLWAPILVGVLGVGALVTSAGAPPTLAVSAVAGPSSTTPPQPSVASTTTTTASSTTTTSTTRTEAPATVTTLAAVAPADPPAVAGTLCPCDPVTGEPLGGAAIEKGVDGVVTDPAGRPIAGFCVTIDKPMPPVAITTTTAADGTFRVELGKTGGIPLMQLDVASCDGSWDTWVPATLRWPELDSNAFNHLTIVLAPPATVNGTAVDQNGQPYTGACVEVYSGDRAVWAPVDAAGHFEALGLPAGNAQALIVYPCNGPPSPPVDGAAPPTFTLVQGQTTTVHLAAFRAGH